MLAVHHSVALTGSAKLSSLSLRHLTNSEQRQRSVAQGCFPDSLKVVLDPRVVILAPSSCDAPTDPT